MFWDYIFTVFNCRELGLNIHSVNALPQHSGSVDKDTFFNVVTTEWEEIKSIFRWN